MSRTLRLLTFRFALISGAMTAVLALLQYLRLGPVLVEAGPAASSLLIAAPLAVPALLTVTLPTGLLISGLMTCRERAFSQQWLAMRLCGVGLGQVMTTLTLYGFAVAALTGLCAFWLAPLGLEELGGALQEVYLEGRLLHSSGSPIIIGDGFGLAAESVRLRESDSALLLTRPWAVRAQDGGATLMRARSGELAKSEMTLEEVRTITKRAGSSQPFIETTHGQVRISLSPAIQKDVGLQRSRWLSHLPETERASSHDLWIAATSSDSKGDRRAGRAWGALNKRMALTLAPPGLLLLAFGLSRPARIEQRGGGDHRGGLFAAVVVCGIYYAMLRLGEVILRDGGEPVWVLALPCGVLALALVVSFGLIWRRW